ncbi:leukocyte cysteine proteinase inhibitor 1-like [Cottoperca gobio]|uniref:Cystatin-B n=1 Tax=Cottoperca gobio TaxID=56716 RepID=A0A6J2RUR5_COTGO|nr:leukocyte cysteine proteinase inhibitor 1-like [Cottoperca gobio]
MANRVELGGWGETKDATGETQNICYQVKDEVEQKTDKKYVDYTATEYRSQIVNGENFLIKVFVGGKDYIHLRVFQFITFVRDVEEIKYVLLGVEQHKTKEDPLVPF